jgi:hypothetical protein
MSAPEAILVNPLPVGRMPTTPIADELWTQWREKGACQDAQIDRNIRVVVAIALAIGAIWASVTIGLT